MNDAELATIEAMKFYGGSFIYALAEAYLRADSVNQAKIRDTWPTEWLQYSILASDSNNIP